MKRILIRLALLFAVAAFLLTLLGFAFIHECDSIGGMGWSVKTCECSGYEWLLYDRTEADGPKRSLCLGIVQARQCFEYVDGPRIDCQALEEN